jgi:integrase
MVNNTQMRIASESGKPMPKRVLLGIRTIEAAVVPTGKERIYLYDQKIHGLALQVMAGGSRVFYLVYRFGGRKRRFRLGDWPGVSVDQARDLAQAALVKLAGGIDPMEVRQDVRRDRTLEQVFVEWLENAKEHLRPRTIVTDASRFKTCLADWRHRRVSTITRADVKAKHAELGMRLGHVTSNRAIQMLRKLLNFAEVVPNPAIRGRGEDKLSLFRETPRVRSLNAEELAKLFTALDQHTDQDLADFFRLALWTGARRSNVSSMAWAEVSLAGFTWTIPAERTKAHNPITIHLAEPAMKILQARCANRKPGAVWVFPSRGATGHLVEVKSAWKPILAAAGIQNFHVHDLRHTLATWMVNQGTDLLVVQRTLGHKDISTTQRYAHLGMGRVREGVERVAKTMLAAGGVGPVAELKADQAR